MTLNNRSSFQMMIYKSRLYMVFATQVADLLTALSLRGFSRKFLDNEVGEIWCNVYTRV